ncbi:MAG: hypothetical protein ABIP55_04995 [Tepidisphaeraceae bacterium]
MSCWVVPSLAAEVWRIPLEQVLRRIREGEIAVREEDGFTFVDVAPYGPRVERPMLSPGERPTMFAAAEETPVTLEELTALDEISTRDKSSDDELGTVDETESEELGDWRAARRKVGRQRIPPPPRRLSA